MGKVPEDIDPVTEDVATKRRSRRNRAQPEPSEQLKGEKEKARERALRRPIPPAIMFEHDGAGYISASPHNDLDLWSLQVADLLGTRSQSVMWKFLDDLRQLCSTVWDEAHEAWKPNERELNAILAMVADLHPKNSAQAALAAQITANHLISMRLAKQALNSGGMIMERDAALFGKLARTQAMLMDSYQSLQGRKRTARQSIKVSRETHHHQHIHVHRGVQETEERLHGTDAGESAERAKVQRDQSGGEIVRLPSRSGPRRV